MFLSYVSLRQHKCWSSSGYQCRILLPPASRETDAFVQSFLTENEQRGLSLDVFVSTLPPTKDGKTLLSLNMANMVSPGHLLLLKMRLKIGEKYWITCPVQVLWKVNWRRLSLIGNREKRKCVISWSFFLNSLRWAWHNSSCCIYTWTEVHLHSHSQLQNTH